MKDRRIFRHPEFERPLAHDVAYRQLTAARVVVDYLTLALAFGQLREHVDADSEDLGAVQHGFDRRVIVRTKLAQRSSFTVAEDLGALVEKDLHGLAAEDFQGELVAHRVYILNGAPDDGALPFRPGRQSVQAGGRSLGGWGRWGDSTLLRPWARGSNLAKGHAGKHQHHKKEVHSTHPCCRIRHRHRDFDVN